MLAMNAGTGGWDEQGAQIAGGKATKKRKRRRKAKSYLKEQNENHNHSAGSVFPSSSQVKVKAEGLSAPATHTGQLAQ